ncbi:D-alanyl-D-alanine dipeptidase [Capsulimonas corticalis]|uniref:D-alanyl-D-alanine dipeptidase n=1 Tax=Capsulimonas corticalis TaxID=2219043 RepID=A0A402CQF2_9BACT|nr:M15 family metallopeptidase [Capsulimonas corticalis]BDI32776.1 D-alanyl-D-alanine dipeptidase [Capsulimonas corticalis]
MARSFGEPLTKLRAVPIIDNGEPLVDPRTLSSRVAFAEKHPYFTEMKCTPHVRKSVAEMIARAADSLPEGLTLTIIEGYRPLAQQRWMYEQIKNEFATKHPEWSKATLHRVTNTMSAPPEDRCPPPHTTGGAFDLGLVDTKTNTPLDMISPFPMDSTSAPTERKGLSDEARRNRDLLVKTLTAAGLTNYAGEWWHWSYGDSGWALRVGAPHAIYGALPADTSPGE